MNRTTKHSTEEGGFRRICRPSIIVSPTARRVTTHGDVVFGLRQHRELGSLPFGFVGHRGKKFMVVTTADLSETMLVLAIELEKCTKNLTVRELNESTVNE